MLEKIAMIGMFSTILMIFVGGIITTFYGIRELRRLKMDAFQHWKDSYTEMRLLSEYALRMNKAANLQEAAQVEMTLKRDADTRESAKEAIKKELNDGKIPVKKPRVVKDVNGREFNMDELEAL